jgi:hypothetical protein
MNKARDRWGMAFGYSWCVWIVGAVFSKDEESFHLGPFWVEFFRVRPVKYSASWDDLCKDVGTTFTPAIRSDAYQNCETLEVVARKLQDESKN